MRAVILAAGRGSRLNSLTANQPKCMVELDEKKLIEWQIGALTAAGAKTVYIVGGYQRDLLHYLSRPIIPNYLWASTNMVYSLMRAAASVPGDLVVSYSDIVYEAEIVKALLQSPGELTLAYDPEWREQWEERYDDPLSDAESFQVDNAGNVTDIGRRVDSYSQISGQYMGLFKISRSCLKRLEQRFQENPELEHKLDMTSLISLMIEDGESIGSVQNKGFWCEIDTEIDLEVAERRLQRHKILKSR